MQTIRLVWDEETAEHVARHGISLEEAEEVCRRNPWLLRGRQGFQYILGQTSAGRYVFVVTLRRGSASKLVTARDMDASERRRYTNR